MRQPANPASDLRRTKLTDEGISTYVELPKDTAFMESMAQNPTFKKGVAYVPVQRRSGRDGALESHVYEIIAGKPKAKHVAGPLQIGTPKTTDITIFGSALSSTGKLYLACFNRNSVLCLDLTKRKEEQQMVEIKNVPAPNDVCIDPDDETVLYVAGGTFRGKLVTFTSAPRGQVLKIKLSPQGPSITSMSSGLDTLAGIEVVGKDIWVAQLYNTISIPKKGGKPKVRWEGTDNNDDYWLADNVDQFDNELVLFPAFATANRKLVNKVLKRNAVAGGLNFLAQVATAAKEHQRLVPALRDPEVALSLSQTVIQDGEKPEPIRLVFAEPKGRVATHFEIDLVETRATHKPREIRNAQGRIRGQRHYFNHSVTHASHLKSTSGQGYIVCINFEQPRVLMLKDDQFRDALNTEMEYAV